MSEVRRLREAARLMREQHGPEHERHAMWKAMAAVLDNAAEGVEIFGTAGQPGSHLRLSLDTADAYLAALPAPTGAGGETP